VAPLLAALVLSVSGFLNELEETTVASVRLADAGRKAPATTQEAAENVADLPAIAELTSRQADAFETLADALEISAQRVFTLNDTLDEQAGTIGELTDGLGDLSDPLSCVEDRLRRLGILAERVPPRLRNIPPVLIRLTAAQEKAIRHLRSINRKLTAFGVAAEASDVEVPPPPDPDVVAPEPGEPGRKAC
jgi:uncharacterized phage infection (PIP) family protein YhgE